MPTDSLYRAYRATLDASDLHAAHQTVTCIRVELMLRHGTYPATLAIDRMMDTVWTARDRDRLRAHDARVGTMSLGVDEACGFPDSLWGRMAGWAAVDHVDPRHRPRYWGNNADGYPVQSRRLQ